jgi:hypothetical protein
MKRPLGVTFLALFYLLGAVLFLVLLVIGILEPEGASVFHRSNLGQDIQHIHNRLGLHLIVVVIFAGIGLGLWFLQSWARRTVLIIAGAHLVRQALVIASSAVVPAAASRHPMGTFFWFATSISTAMVVYLLQPPVKRAFASHERPG